MALVAAGGLPVWIRVYSALPHEAALAGIKPTIAAAGMRSLRSEGVELIAPLRRYVRRWKVERLFAWLQIFMRLVTRYEQFVAFVELETIIILIRRTF